MKRDLKLQSRATHKRAARLVENGKFVINFASNRTKTGEGAEK